MPKLRCFWATVLTLTALTTVAIGPRADAGNMPAEIMRERFVEENVFTSTHAPSVRIAVDHQLEYLGRLEFSIGPGLTERYLFGSTQEQTVERLFVVEVSAADGAAPDAPSQLEVAGEQYAHSTSVVDHARRIQREPAAALARTTAYLEKQGLRLPAQLVIGQLSRSAGADRSRRFAIHYAEDSRRAGRAIDSASESDVILSGEDQVAAQLTERFLASFRVLDR